MAAFNSNKPYSKDFNRAETPQKSFPQGYLKDGYFEDGSLKREFVLGYATAIADMIATDRNAISKGKLRKYYDEVVNAYEAFERRVLSEKEAIHRVERLYAPAYSDVSKQKAPKQFAEFIKINLDNIKTIKDLKAFKEHFESIVCFYPDKK